ncbi:uncharacterized protein Dana_GF27715 [Drosophila ananassae]|uniref:Uncharacterized protein n=1 Tax=Drosophila ananassae TaxID=7217 RepID=A0A0P8XIM5_DROAN|nr:uncharacterized protein Dana_GF27715 [Drosophila ananassae]
MKKVYGDDCLSRSRVHEWFQRFNSGREDINDDEQVGQPKSVITENSIEPVTQHLKDIIKEAKKDPNFLYKIVTGDETWCFQYDPETKRQSAEWMAPDEPKPKKSRLEKSKVKKMLICFYDCKGIVYKELVPPGQNVNGVLKRLVRRIRHVRPEYRDDGSWHLHDDAPSLRSTLMTDYVTKNHILSIPIFT